MGAAYPTPPKLLFFGDPHGDFTSVIQAVEALQPQAVILLGDMQATRPLHVELAPIISTDIWFIPGNHDTDSELFYDNLWGSTLGNKNLHGRVAQIAGYNVAGLGGVFRNSIWNPELSIEKAAFPSPQALLRHMKRTERWRDGISLRHRSSVFPSDFTYLSNQRADILVTHEGLASAAFGQPVLNDLARSLGANLVVHGHLHQDIDYEAQGLLPAGSNYKVFGVNQGSYLRWPPERPAKESGR